MPTIEFWLYKILACHAAATDAEIRTAYLRAAKVAHPDKGGSETRMAELNIAYAQVRDAKGRASLAALLRVLGDPCTQCGATGAVQRTRSFAAADVSPCSACCGAAYQPRL